MFNDLSVFFFSSGHNQPSLNIKKNIKFLICLHKYKKSKLTNLWNTYLKAEFILF